MSKIESPHGDDAYQNRSNPEAEVDPRIVPGFTLRESQRLRNVRADLLYTLRRNRLKFLRHLIGKGILRPGRD